MRRPDLSAAERDEKRITMIIMGLVIPLVVSWFGSNAWITQEAKWPQRGGPWITVEGAVAKSLGMAYLGIALGCLSNWGFGYFWYHRLRVIGVALGTLMIFGGVIAGLLFMNG